LFPRKSIKNGFILQLLVASAALLIFFSSILYLYIQQSIYNERKRELVAMAMNITKTQFENEASTLANSSNIGITISLVHLKQKNISLLFNEEEIGDDHYLLLYYPFEYKKSSYIKIRKDFTATKHMLQRILNSIFLINAISLIFIVIYAIFVAKLLLTPITSLTKKLSKMNENFIKPIELNKLPEEFVPLGEGVNMLINRIQTFVKYQKELFIGTAHELKTPLAVIKLKNEVTLIKERPAREYIEALRTTNESVNAMNNMVTNILNIGRQEGAQFEKPSEVNVIDIIKQQGYDFQLLAEDQNKHVEISCNPSAYQAFIQVTLLKQIIQNFLQNALKFTEEGKKVTLQSLLTSHGLEISVIDEGCGLQGDMDLFAPFKRQGQKSGAGLGLFLAKSAADTLNAHIDIRNRTDAQGAIATLTLNSTLTCLLPSKSS
jgi:two-component system, OmpR family, sensor kinase